MSERVERPIDTTYALPTRLVAPRPPAGTRRLPPVVGVIGDPGSVAVVVAGARISLRAASDADRFALETAVATAGLPYDRKQNTRLPAFRRLLRRGTSRFESVALHAELLGLPLDVDATARLAISDYRTRLWRALSPIPRTVWVDPAVDDAGDETVEELSLRRR